MIAGRRWGVMWRVPWLRGGGQPQGRLLSSSRFGTDDDGGCKCGAQEQWTLRRALTFRGIGLHSGEPCTVTIRPAPVDHGITFETDDGASVTGRADRIGAAKVSARWTSVVDTTLCTVLGNAPPTPLGQRGQRAGILLARLGASAAGNWLAGATFSTVEHLLAALAGAGIDNAAIALSGAEVPIMDGSARDFSAAFAEPGALRAMPRSQRRCVHVLREVAVEAMGGRRVALRPHCEPGDTFRGALRISVQVDYGHRMRAQHFEMERREFASAASAARTFCFAEDVAKMRWSGLAKGGSLDNAVVFSREGRVLNPEGLRFENEAARHKALDVLGDLALGGALVGQYSGSKPGHSLNIALLKKLFASPDNFSVT